MNEAESEHELKVYTTHLTDTKGDTTVWSTLKFAKNLYIAAVEKAEISAIREELGATIRLQVLGRNQCTRFKSVIATREINDFLSYIICGELKFPLVKHRLIDDQLVHENFQPGSTKMYFYKNKEEHAEYIVKAPPVIKNEFIDLDAQFSPGYEFGSPIVRISEYNNSNENIPKEKFKIIGILLMNSGERGSASLFFNKKWSAKTEDDLKQISFVSNYNAIPTNLQSKVFCTTPIVLNTNFNINKNINYLYAEFHFGPQSQQDKFTNVQNISNEPCFSKLQKLTFKFEGYKLSQDIMQLANICKQNFKNVESIKFHFSFCKTDSQNFSELVKIFDYLEKLNEFILIYDGSDPFELSNLFSQSKNIFTVTDKKTQQQTKRIWKNFQIFISGTFHFKLDLSKLLQFWEHAFLSKKLSIILKVSDVEISEYKPSEKSQGSQGPQPNEETNIKYFEFVIELQTLSKQKDSHYPQLLSLIRKQYHHFKKLEYFKLELNEKELRPETESSCGFKINDDNIFELCPPIENGFFDCLKEFQLVLKNGSCHITDVGWYVLMNFIQNNTIDKIMISLNSCKNTLSRGSLSQTLDKFSKSSKVQEVYFDITESNYIKIDLEELLNFLEAIYGGLHLVSVKFKPSQFDENQSVNAFQLLGLDKGKEDASVIAFLHNNKKIKKLLENEATKHFLKFEIEEVQKKEIELKFENMFKKINLQSSASGKKQLYLQ